MATRNIGFAKVLLGRIEPRHFRRALLWMAAIPAALIVAAITMIVTVDPQDVRRAIADEAKQLTGLELTADGPVKLRVWPRPSVEGGPISLANLAWTKAPSLFIAQRFRVELGILRLLTGRMRVTRLDLSGPELFLEIGPDGALNWTFPTGSLDAVKIEDASHPDAPVIPSIVQLGIREGRITLSDHQNGEIQRIKLDRVDLSSTDLPGFTALSVDGAFNEEAIKVTGFLSTLDKLVWGGRGFSILTEIDAVGSKIRVRGNIGRPGFSNLLRLGISARGPDVQASLKRLKTQVPALADVTLPVAGAYRLAARFRGPADSFSVRDIDVALGQEGALQIAVRGAINRVLTQRLLNLTVTLKGPDIRALDDWASLSLPRLPPFQISGILRGSKGRYEVDNLDSRIGRTTFVGNLSADIRTNPPKISGALNASMIDLGEIVGSLDLKQSLTRELSKLNLDLKLLGKTVAAGPVSLTGAVAGLRVENGSLKMDPLLAGLEGGRLVGTASLLAAGSPRTFLSRLSTRNIDLVRLGTLLGINSERLSGLERCHRAELDIRFDPTSGETGFAILPPGCQKGD